MPHRIHGLNLWANPRERGGDVNGPMPPMIITVCGWSLSVPEPVMRNGVGVEADGASRSRGLRPPAGARSPHPHATAPHIARSAGVRMPSRRGWRRRPLRAAAGRVIRGSGTAFALVRSFPFFRCPSPGLRLGVRGLPFSASVPLLVSAGLPRRSFSRRPRGRCFVRCFSMFWPWCCAFSCMYRVLSQVYAVSMHFWGLHRFFFRFSLVCCWSLLLFASDLSAKRKTRRKAHRTHSRLPYNGFSESGLYSPLHKCGTSPPQQQIRHRARHHRSIHYAA